MVGGEPLEMLGVIAGFGKERANAPTGHGLIGAQFVRKRRGNRGGSAICRATGYNCREGNFSLYGLRQ